MTAADDCFAFPERTLLHEEAIGLLRALVVPAPGKESVSVFAATGRVCAEAVKASRGEASLRLASPKLGKSEFTPI